MIKQLSVFIENKPGRLAEMMQSISDAGVNIHALSIADTTDFGILRLIVDDADSAKEILKAQGLTVKVTEVLAVALEHKPGSLAHILRELGNAGASIEYIYASTNRGVTHDAMAIISLGNPAEVMAKSPDIKLLTQADIA